MLTFLLSVLLMAYEPAKVWADSRVRRVQVLNDQIVTVKTAQGVATIVQVPDRPNSIVVGDQGAFKVEYLDQAITIKPNRPGARSNLYVYTDFRRFNIQLVTTNESNADYVVYLENPTEKIKQPNLKWLKFKNSQNNDGLVFETKRLAQTADGVLLVEFEIRSSKVEKMKPEWIWLTQNKVVRSINHLVISDQSTHPQKPIKGVLQILKNDIESQIPLKIEIRRQKSTFLTLPKVNEWK